MRFTTVQFWGALRWTGRSLHAYSRSPALAASSSLSLDVAAPRVGEKSPNGDWICEYTLQGIGLGDTGRAYGVDSIQALLQAPTKAKLELDSVVRSNGGRVTWLGGESLGLPNIEAPPRG